MYLDSEKTYGIAWINVAIVFEGSDHLFMGCVVFCVATRGFAGEYVSKAGNPFTELKITL